MRNLLLSITFFSLLSALNIKTPLTDVSIAAAQPLRVCLNTNNGRVVSRRRCDGARFTPLTAELLQGLTTPIPGEQGLKGDKGDKGDQGDPGAAEFELVYDAGDSDGLRVGSGSGPEVDGSSTDIGELADYKGVIVEWKLDDRPEVYQQWIYTPLSLNFR